MTVDERAKMISDNALELIIHETFGRKWTSVEYDRIVMKCCETAARIQVQAETAAERIWKDQVRANCERE